MDVVVFEEGARSFIRVGPFGNTSLKVTLRHVICERSGL